MRVGSGYSGAAVSPALEYPRRRGKITRANALRTQREVCVLAAMRVTPRHIRCVHRQCALASNDGRPSGDAEW